MWLKDSFRLFNLKLYVFNWFYASFSLNTGPLRALGAAASPRVMIIRKKWNLECRFV